MPFVIDASVTAAWLLPDESHPLAERCLDALGDDLVLVPAIWWFETCNLLIMAERRKRITPEGVQEALKAIAQYPIRQESAIEETRAFRLARAHNLSFYDAAYLELAHRLALPLATLDRRLAAAAAAENLPDMR